MAHHAAEAAAIALVRANTQNSYWRIEQFRKELNVCVFLRLESVVWYEFCLARAAFSERFTNKKHLRNN